MRMSRAPAGAKAPISRSTAVSVPGLIVMLTDYTQLRINARVYGSRTVEELFRSSDPAARINCCQDSP